MTEQECTHAVTQDAATLSHRKCRSSEGLEMYIFSLTQVSSA